MKSFLFLVLLFFILCSSIYCPDTKEPAIKSVFGLKSHSELDSEIANKLFRYMAAKDTNNWLFDSISSQISSLHHQGKLKNGYFQELSSRYSLDFATLMFAKSMYDIPENRNVHRVYLSHLENLKNNSIDTSLLHNACQFEYVFVPGLFYEKYPKRGGDFARQRKLLSQFKIKAHLIKTNEIGTIEQNAEIITSFLNKITKTNKKVVLISVSKGSPDLLFALKNVSNEVLNQIHAWVSVGGVMNGSLLANRYSQGIKGIIAKVTLRSMGGDFELVEDLSYNNDNSMKNIFNLSQNMHILHFIGAPISCKIRKMVAKNYYRFSKIIGPNDGFTSLYDEILPGGKVITELGLDHFYIDENIDKKAIAVIFTAIGLEALNNQNSISIFNN